MRSLDSAEPASKGEIIHRVSDEFDVPETVAGTSAVGPT